jgi:hypothetical protein
VGAVLATLHTTAAHPTHAETGQGDDIFRVIMTIFGVDKSKGDIIAIVTANIGEASRVKFLDSEAPYVVSMANPNTPGAEGGLIEYVATFPNVTINTGTEYKTCVMTTKDLELLCKTGHNSPASRPEFVDINLNEITASGIEQLETETETLLINLNY